MDFELEDTGTGPVLLFLPGSYSNPAAWKGVQRSLKGSYRLVTTSLPGYGGSKEVRGESVTDMSLMSNFVAEVVAHIGEPVHLISHSYGGLTAFAAVLSGKVSPLSLVTFEANPIYSRLDDGDFPWAAAFDDLTARFESAYASGDADAASLIIDFWSEPGFFNSMPEGVQEYCRSTVYSNILDWRSAAGFKPTVSEYAAIDVPTTVVRGEFAIKPMVDLCDEVSKAVPEASLKIVKGSGHFLISTHSQECAAIIDDHMHNFALWRQQQHSDS